MGGATVLAQANLTLAQQNARLAYENEMLRKDNMLRMQALVPQPPPGLEHDLPIWPYTALTHSVSARTARKAAGQGKKAANGGRLGSSRGSEVSTAAASSPRCSLDNSLNTSDNDHDGCQNAGTSAMMRNLPNDYTRGMLLDLLCKEGFAGFFDFVYLPIDFRSCSGLGYAFVNFTSLVSAEKFYHHFTGFSRWAVASDKVCEVTWSSLQGLDAHVERYRNSPVMHEDVPDKYKPVLYENGERIAFPPPTKKIRPPRVKKSGGSGKAGGGGDGDGGDHDAGGSWPEPA